MSLRDTCADASPTEPCEGEVLSREGTCLCTSHHDRRLKDTVNSHATVDDRDARTPGSDAGQDGLDLGSSIPRSSSSRSTTDPLFPWRMTVSSEDAPPPSPSRVVSVGSHHSSNGPNFEDTPARDPRISISSLQLLTTSAFGGSGKSTPAYAGSVSGITGANELVLAPALENSGRDDELELERQGHE